MASPAAPLKHVDAEVKALAEVRRRLCAELAVAPAFPEVVGDRRLLRFLRGHQMNLDVATEKVRDMLRWRREAGVDEIRADIVARGLASPWDAPYGEEMRTIFPVMLPSRACCDRLGQPVTVENFGFNPEEALARVEPGDILRFHYYVMEMKALVLARWSEEMDEAAAGGATEAGWSTAASMLVVRDFSGFRLDVLTNRRSRDLISQIITSTSNYYPELMHSCLMINTPMVFNMVWRAVKPVIAKSTQEKVAIIGSRFLSTLLEKMPEKEVPVMLGGPTNAAGYDVQRCETPGGWVPGMPGSLGQISPIPPAPVAEDAAEGAMNPADEGNGVANVPPPPEGPAPAASRAFLATEAPAAAAPTSEPDPQLDGDPRKRLVLPDNGSWLTASLDPVMQESILATAHQAAWSLAPEHVKGQDFPSTSTSPSIDSNVGLGTPGRVHSLAPSPPAATLADWGSTAEDVDKLLRRALTVLEWQLSQEWVRNEQRRDCSLCARRFTRVFRRHHCRICGEVVCGKCSPFRARVDALAGIRQGPHGDQRDLPLLQFQRASSSSALKEATGVVVREGDTECFGCDEDEDDEPAEEQELSGPSREWRRSLRRMKRVRLCVKCYSQALAVHLSELATVRREQGAKAADAIRADWTNCCRFPSPRRLQDVQMTEAGLVSRQRGQSCSSPGMLTRSAPSSPMGFASRRLVSAKRSRPAQSQRAVDGAFSGTSPKSGSYWSDDGGSQELQSLEGRRERSKKLRRADHAFGASPQSEWRVDYGWVCKQMALGEKAPLDRLALRLAEKSIDECMKAFVDILRDVGMDGNPQMATSTTILLLFFPATLASLLLVATVCRVGIRCSGRVAKAAREKKAAGSQEPAIN